LLISVERRLNMDSILVAYDCIVWWDLWRTTFEFV